MSRDQNVPAFATGQTSAERTSLDETTAGVKRLSVNGPKISSA